MKKVLLTAALFLTSSASSAQDTAANLNRVQSFTNRTTGDTQVYVQQIGNQNSVQIEQVGTINNYVQYQGTGNSNTVTINQIGSNNSDVNYVELAATGNNNIFSLLQMATGGTKSVFGLVAESNNSLTIQQRDSGSHYAEINLSGGNKNVDILQQGSGSHTAKITLSGSPAELSLTQSGAVSQNYLLNYTCTVAAGCSKIIVNQSQ